MRRGRKKKIRTGFAGFLAGLFFVLSGTGFRLQAAAAVMESNAPGDVAVTGTAAEEENVSIPELSLNSQSAVLMDVKTGRIVYGKEADTIRPMASTTKIMTCILALEQGNPEELVEVSSYAASMPDVQLNIRAGEKYKLKDLLYSLMLESHNDTAVMIAEHLGGSVEEFARMMNQKARDLGCENTCFVTPNGLDATVTMEDGSAKIHSTTAAELASIMAYCVWQSPKKEEFLEITRTQNYFFTDIEGKGSYSCVNHNALLSMVDGAISGKTGFTNGAGYSYVAALEDDGRHFTLALLGCGWPPHKTYKWNDARAIFQYAREQFQWREIYQKPDLPEIPVEEGVTENGRIGETVCARLTVDTAGKESLKVLMQEGEEATMHCRIPDSLTAPVTKGQVVGQVDYMLEGSVIRSDPVYVETSVNKISFGWCIQKTANMFPLCKKS